MINSHLFDEEIKEFSKYYDAEWQKIKKLKIYEAKLLMNFQI